MIEEFFKNIAYRLRNENDLSDITWAMTQTSDTFLNAFLQFFFPNEKFQGEIELHREKSEDESRPDFYFEYQGKIYVIENKIYDQNHHFQQYIKEFKIQAEQLGYITNYYMKEPGFVVHTWTDFYAYLKTFKRIPQPEKALWDGYLSYIQNVCSINYFTKPMNLEGMYSLYEFYSSLEKVLSLNNEQYTIEAYTSKFDDHQAGNKYSNPRYGCMGKYFHISFKELRIKEGFGWMGVYFNCEQPSICIGFSKANAHGVYQVLKANESKFHNRSRYFEQPYNEEDAIWFEFKKRDEFNSKPFDEQIAMLQQFVAQVADYICRLKSN